MEEFLSEHGAIIISSIVSLFTIVLIVIVMIVVSNMYALSVTSLI